MKTFKIIIYYLMAVFFVGLIGIKYSENANAQTKYRGEIRGHQIVIEVKNKSSAVILPYSAAVWDDTPINIFNHAIRCYVDNKGRVTMDSINGATAGQGDTLSVRDSAWKLSIRPYGAYATTADTLIVYGTVVPDPFYSLSADTFNTALITGVKGDTVARGDTITFRTGNLMATDSMFTAPHYYYDIDSARVLKNSSSSLDSVLLQAVPLFYVKQADSLAGTGQFAGIPQDTIKIDSTDKTIGTIGKGTGSGMMAIWGLSKARITANPDSMTYKGNLYGVATSAGIFKKLFNGMGGIQADSADTLGVVQSVYPFYPKGGAYTDTILVKIRY